MNIGKRKFWILSILLCVSLIIVMQIVHTFFGEEERKVRTQIREALIEKYPETVDQLKAVYGLKPFEQSNTPLKDHAQKPMVILVHGLDDPGKVWMNLAPALQADGFPVSILTYPNDQPITASARFFLKQIESHNIAGSISIVAHSMGGLVAREMLTNPELRYAEKSERGELPSVNQLIMVGTPNHGSELARFRIFAEFREQLGNLFKDDYYWLQGIVDGAGEAGMDLIPGSVFLTRLNSRPHPENVSLMVIAGVMSQKQKSAIEALAHNLEDNLREDTQGAAQEAEHALLSMAKQIGDGLVSVDSARLTGIDFKIVNGTHLTMIRNITEGSQRIPPAIPIIMERQNRSLSKI